jgi:hypothetical protein
MNKVQERRMTFVKFEGTETTRGEGLKKETWYSICSRHGVYDKNCELCNTGSWQNDHKLAVEGWFYDNAYWLWHFWVNNI